MGTSESDDVEYYYVYRNGTLKEALPYQTEYTDTHLEANTEYRYRVEAVDRNGNVLDTSNEIKVKTKE